MIFSRPQRPVYAAAHTLENPNYIAQVLGDSEGLGDLGDSSQPGGNPATRSEWRRRDHGSMRSPVSISPGPGTKHGTS